jgi:tRNA nucleotidyltransferase (CCA-adding enzyme)
MRVPAALDRARADLPPAIEKVLRTLAGAGHRSWVVGGVVRDVLLGRHREANDYDLATPARPEQVVRLFRKVIPTGIAHGTVTVLLEGEAIEVTTFRGEGSYVDGRRPETVTFLEDLEADLARRDFTMNALAWDPLAPDFRDPFGGQEDIQRRLVRAVGDPRERFAEDGLRPMRAVRFAAQLGYDLDPATRDAIPGALDVVRKVSVERISDELARLVVAPHAPRALALMRETGLLATVLPALAAVAPAALDHAIAVLAEVPGVPTLRFAALLHVLPAGEAERILVGLRQPGRICHGVAALLGAHACRLRDPAPPLPRSPVEVRRWLSRVGHDHVEPLLALADAEGAVLPAPRSAAARDDVARLASDLDALRRAPPPLFPQDLALDGRAAMAILGAGPGPHVGEALRHLLDRVLEDPALNEPGALEAELRAWWSARPGKR